MADNTNIDEILKSIDALLKEGNPENGSDQDVGDQSSKQRATNDDEVSDPEMPDASASIGNEKDEADAPAAETIEHEPAEHQETDEAETDEAETDDQPSEDTQPEDVPEVDTTAGQAPEQGQGLKRIVLSEAMLVEDTPDLPLAFATAENPTEDVQTDNSLSEESSPEHGDQDESDESWEPAPSALLSDTEIQTQAGRAEVEDEAVADASALDMGRLIEQITAEISARLQQQLPGMVAGMVAEAMEKNLAAHAAPDDESTNDRQN